MNITGSQQLIINCIGSVFFMGYWVVCIWGISYIFRSNRKRIEDFRTECHWDQFRLKRRNET